MSLYVTCWFWQHWQFVVLSGNNLWAQKSHHSVATTVRMLPFFCYFCLLPAYGGAYCLHQQPSQSGLHVPVMSLYLFQALFSPGHVVWRRAFKLLTHPAGRKILVWQLHFTLHGLKGVNQKEKSWSSGYVTCACSTQPLTWTEPRWKKKSHDPRDDRTKKVLRL